MPLYRLDDRLVLFVHIPKTGGTTVESWLSKLGPEALKDHRKGEGLLTAPQHIHTALMERIMPADFYDDAFCIVRDPLERLLSEYRYRTAQRTRHRARLDWGARREASRLSKDFARWTRKQLSRARLTPTTGSNHIRPQSDFLGIAKCRVYRVEDGLDTIMADLAARWDVPPPSLIPHENATRKIPFEIDLATRRRIDAFYAEDFERLGYLRAADRG